MAKGLTGLMVELKHGLSLYGDKQFPESILMKIDVSHFGLLHSSFSSFYFKCLNNTFWSIRIEELTKINHVTLIEFKACFNIMLFT